MKKNIILITFILTLFFVLPANANTPDFFIKRAQERITQENYQGAVEDLTKAGYMKPNNFKIMMLRAEAQKGMGNYKAAAVDYTKCIKMASQNESYSDKIASLYSARAEAKQKLKDFKGALKDYKTAKEIHKQQNDFAGYKATLEPIKTLETKISQQQAEIQSRPDANYYMGLAKTAFKNRDYENAVYLTSKAVVLSPNKPSIFKARAMAKANLRDFEGALEDLYKARDLYEQLSDFEGYEKVLKLIEKIQAQ